MSSLIKSKKESIAVLVGCLAMVPFGIILDGIRDRADQKKLARVEHEMKHETITNVWVVNVLAGNWYTDNANQVPSSLATIGQITESSVRDYFDRYALSNPFTGKKLLVYDVPELQNGTMICPPFRFQPGDISFQYTTTDSTIIWAVKAFDQAGEPFFTQHSRRWINGHKPRASDFQVMLYH